jgi:hypothetical protein
MDFVLWLVKLLLLPVGFVAGLFLPHVQKPLTDYRKTLTDISKAMLNNIHAIYEPRDRYTPASSEERNLYYSLRGLHAQLLSSANSIPRFARPILQAVGLLQSPAKIKEGAQMLIGISNHIVSATGKDLPHITTLIEKLKTALDIAA